ncbi:hypothetical protein KY337_04280 [Candidatus Woesearchaeota archaeon]|nr:hypothetical protein [Candidatus Woesearchaeota archaeon]
MIRINMHKDSVPLEENVAESYVPEDASFLTRFKNNFLYGRKPVEDCTFPGLLVGYGVGAGGVLSMVMPILSKEQQLDYMGLWLAGLVVAPIVGTIAIRSLEALTDTWRGENAQPRARVTEVASTSYNNTPSTV